MKLNWAQLTLWSIACFWAGGSIEFDRQQVHDVRAIERRLREVFCEQAISQGLLKTCYPDGLPPPMPLPALDAGAAKPRG